MDPISLLREVEERYRRYLHTTFYFKDPTFRSSFAQALASGHLSKGPYLEATPVFKRGKTPRALFPEVVTQMSDEGFLKALESDRPFYQHQEEAIRKSVDGRNTVIATGTGSGKTEAFLYPILLHLYREFLGGTLCPGVRALILYPMNALANDQRERLGNQICRRLKEEDSPFEFTFGQYIGETPKDENDTWRHAQEHRDGRLPGELVFRSEMIHEPPHILLTNYSMLEYLLLRPYDSPLFDNGAAKWWTFLVLDEAHQYRGSRGMEMGMLVRRLKQRLREGGRTGPFRCVATSATLAGDEGDKFAVARFASDLFDEDFHGDDVILGTTEPIPRPSSESLRWEDYRLLREAMDCGSADSARDLSGLGARLSVSLPAGEDYAKMVGRLLRHDARAAGLRQLVTDSPRKVEEVANEVFGDLSQNQRLPVLTELVALLLRAEDPETGSPLLSARYHLFLRALEGAFVSYWPDRKVFLDRGGAEGDATASEVALCRECGQHYLVGNIDHGRLVEAIRDPGHAEFGATFFRPIESEASAEEGGQVYRLCPCCAKIWGAEEGPACPECRAVDSVLLERQNHAAEREDQVPKCSACGFQAPDPVREVIHGTDGPHAVIATGLHQNLPRGRNKVLAFADGRQEAAFFAWYLESTYEGILSRGLILEAIRNLAQHAPGGVSLRELVVGLCGYLRDREILPPATGDIESLREGWLRAYREFLTDEQRISLEGVGLVRWFPKWPKWVCVPDELRSPPWSLEREEAFDLLAVLLNSMRIDRAVELRTENGVNLNWRDLGLQARQMRVRIGNPGGQKSVRSWDGRTGRRAQILAKYARSAGLSEQEALEQAVSLLRAIWQTLQESEQETGGQDRLLVPTGDARRLNPDWWRVLPVMPENEIFRCDVCGRLQSVSVRGLCPRHRCPGKLKKVKFSDLETNHYRSLYAGELAGSIRVEEHTAQLEKAKAREFQREFRSGRIDVLSCSTTFELGVDLGDLDTIFLRNVPPEAFNYAQRVGRAGRRRGHPGFAITYCKRGPHDLYHFGEPERMLKGRIRPPVLSMQNEKIVLRHVTATVLSSFFRSNRERFGDVADMCGDLENPTAASDFRAFLHEHQDDLEDTLRAVVPPGVLAEIDLDDASWIDKVVGKDSRFQDAESEVSSDYRSVRNLRERAHLEEDDVTYVWAGRRANTIAGEDVLSFLSRKAVIPKYGFPVDVVDLDTQGTGHDADSLAVSLQRDLSIAIAEFAPTSKLIANKKEWISYGLKKVIAKEWSHSYYKRCGRHNVFLHWDKGTDEPPMPCGDREPRRQYIVPLFGFVTNRDRPKAPKSRGARVFTTRPYFAGPLGPDPGTLRLPTQAPLVEIRKASPGLMVVLCEGRRGEGFCVCKECGAGFRQVTRPHQTPWAKPCNGTLDIVALGHEFETDVVQLRCLVPVQTDDLVWFAYSLAYALAEGAAEVLEIPSNDLSAVVSHSSGGGVPPIVLYDNVPGGAGLVARLEREKVLRECLEVAHNRVANCKGCSEASSCYSCLRSYRNQFAHQYLQRGPVKRYLEEILRCW